ncbi:MAG: Gfo/Idh/MocA family oxidoreductase, partial [Bacteroidota bacterium]|nr:Gfo/Idh/MocA family oxidoreductase [Bacteroidota bacterium]
MESKKSSRRLFLKQAAAFSALAALPTILTRTASGMTLPTTKLASASERVNLACCGIGNRAAEDINAMYNTGLVNIVALCDVDMGAPQTLEILKKFPNVPRFQDFRKMFDKMSNQIDAVCVAVPDFSHFPITMLAMNLGKHVYC